MEFLNELGVSDIQGHLKFCVLRAIQLMGSFLEAQVCSKTIAADDFNILANETTDIADQMVMSAFTRYVDTQKITFLWI